MRRELLGCFDLAFGKGGASLEALAGFGRTCRAGHCHGRAGPRANGPRHLDRVALTAVQKDRVRCVNCGWDGEVEPNPAINGYERCPACGQLSLVAVAPPTRPK